MRPSRALFGAQSRLLRDFIADSLYNLQHGYFSKQAPPVGFLDPPIDFCSLQNRAAYFAHVQRRYAALQVAWLTPVEIFSPHYGAAIANYLTTQHLSNTSTNNKSTDSIDPKNKNNNEKKKDVPLIVYEIGGGTGTLAKDILNWLKQHHPGIHATCRYTCIEISPTLANLQYQRVVEEQHGVHEDQFQVVQGDASKIATWHKITLQRGKENRIKGPSIKISKPNSHIHQQDTENATTGDHQKHDAAADTKSEPCFVVAMEVLDNLPHDKVVYNKESNEIGSDDDDGDEISGHWLETWVTETHNTSGNNNRQNEKLHSSYQENFQLVQDPLIHRCLHTWLEMESSNTSTLDSKTGFLQKLIDTAAAIIDHGANGGGGGSGKFSSRESIFLPTRALQLFDTLHTVCPNHQLLAADFDYLPETVIHGKNAPLVATTIDGVTKDYGSYFVHPGEADIFFPSDFELLSRLYDHSRMKNCSGGGLEGSSGGKNVNRAEHMKSREFFEKWATGVGGEEIEVVDGKKRRLMRVCRDGYDPLLEDYSNTGFLVS